MTVGSSHQTCSMKKGVLRDFTKFTGKHRLRPATLLKKRLWHRCFPVNFAKFLRTPFLQNTSGRLLLTGIIHYILLYFRLAFTSSNCLNRSLYCYTETGVTLTKIGDDQTVKINSKGVVGGVK